MRQLKIEVKILVFKTLAISKVVHLALVKDVPCSTIAQLEKIQKQFIWKNGNPKWKHTTLEILARWEKYLSSHSKVLSAVVSQFIWYNEYIKIDNNIH